MPRKLAFVDLETTGTSPALDRITEVGIVLADEDGLREWSSLVDPGRPIPPMIQSLTGISNAMVAGAPRFASLAADIAQRLEGYVFVAHNARFDQGFLQAEMARAGVPFSPPVLCTVKLSRKLYPQQRRHGLDALIQRHALRVDPRARHRALGDARLLWQFWQAIGQDFPASHIDALVDALTGRVAWPARLDPDLPDRLPDAPGVYVLRNEHGQALYVGKATALRARVLSHFDASRQASAKAQRLAQQTHDIQWTVTAGPIGALLLEARLMRTVAPLHNRRPARTDPACPAWPYDGPVGIREGGSLHVVDRWQWLGSADSDDALWPLLDVRPDTPDPEVHRILRDRLPGLPIVSLPPRGG